MLAFLPPSKRQPLLNLHSILIFLPTANRGINVGSRLDFEDLLRFVQDHHMSFDDIIDRKFKFEEAEEAFKYLASGGHFGKVVIQVA